MIHKYAQIAAGNSLMARCLRACGWVSLGGVLLQIIRTTRMWVLTWLLAPEMFGILALVWCVLGLLREMSDTGFRHGLIQNPRGQQKEYMDVAWNLILLRNILLIGILYASAPFIALRIYDNPPLLSLLRLCCLILLFEGLSSVSMVVLRKELSFRLVVIVQVVSHTIGLIVALALSWWLRNAVAVVISEIVSSAVMCVLSYVIHPYRPSLRWNGTAARELIGFGFVVYVASLLNSLGLRFDVIMLGKMAGDAELGIYGLAMAAILLPCGVFALLTISVGLPALSLLQHDIGRIRRGCAEVFKVTQLIALPIFASTAIFADDLVRVLPEKYAGISEPLRLLCIFGYFQVFLRQLTPILYALKRLYWNVLRAFLYLCMVVPLLVVMYERSGLPGVCWAVNISLAISTIFMLVVVLRILRWPLKQWLREMVVVAFAILGGLLGFGLIWLALKAAGYEWSSYFTVRCLCWLGGMIGYGVPVWRYYHNSGHPFKMKTPQ